MTNHRISLFLLILITACTSQPGKVPPAFAVKLETIDLANSWDKPEVVNLSTIADSIFYIPLETKPGSLIGGENGVEIVLLKDYLVVYENNKTLKLFSRSGRYLLTFGSKGKGPGEYIEARDFVCDETADRVYVLDGNQQKIIVYDFRGKLKAEIKTARWPCEITVSPDHEIGVLYLAFRTTLDSARLEWLTPEGSLRRKIPLYQNRQPAATATWGSTKLYWIDGNLRIVEPPFDTIYQLDPTNGFMGYTAIAAGPEGIPRNLWFDEVGWRREAGDYYITANIVDSKRFVFLESNGKRFCNFLYDRNSGEIRQIESHRIGDLWMVGFLNDLDGGLPFWPRSIQGEYLLKCLSTIEIQAFRKEPGVISADSLVNPNLRNRFRAILDNFKEFDNPVVMVVKLKKQ